VTSRLQSLVSSPAAGFDEPFKMLQACHERIERTLDLLARLRTHLGTHGADRQAQQAARDVMRYFDLAAPHHHRDEELHVFPPLLAHGDAPVRALVQKLEQDHLQMDARWEDARAVLARIAAGELAQLETCDDEALDAFAALYADHLAAEEEIAYPAARPLLDSDALARAGDEMKRRRGAG
jgi:hemerythrin-like domain-containing protein